MGTAVLLTAVLTLACAVLPRGLALVAVSDTVCALLMFSALLAFALNGVASKGRFRVFWMLQAAGWGLWLGDQVVWIVWDLGLQKKMPPMSAADVLLLLAGVPMLAGLLLRPHLRPSESTARLGILDFLLLLLWWLYLYVFFIICWQYISPNTAAYDRNWDLLSTASSIVLTSVLAVFWRTSSGAWRAFYARFFAVAVFNGVAFYVLNQAIEKDRYFTGSWYDVPYTASFAAFTAVALSGRGLSPTDETRGDEAYGSWMATLAMVAVLSLPVMALSALLGRDASPVVERFRIIATLATMFVMALLIFLKHHRFNQELKRANTVLEEASLTDPLTGIRNRRYFSASIAADISQTLRSYADSHDPRTRDLVFYLIDADNFKEINDRFGHDAGDRVLVEMSRRISLCVRLSDVLVRWGGEEFLIVSRYTDRRDATILAARVLAAVADTPFVLYQPDETIYRTCSIGWAAFPWLPKDPEAIDYDEVLSLADQGLRQAKRSGKNRAVGMVPAARTTPNSATPDTPRSNQLPADALAVAGPSPQSTK
ncbi:MAG: GGDEF domain-containing protein [Acidobacteriia bacterium]|nr:GGDEF domain-containing protein [Terriglobia bacterium]